MSDVSPIEVNKLAIELSIDLCVLYRCWLRFHEAYPEYTWDDYASIRRAGLYRYHNSEETKVVVTRLNRSVSLTDKAKELVRKACDSVGKKLGLSVEYDL